jgi:hypothetical protein
MFKVTYDEEAKTCTLECPWCGQAPESKFPRPDATSVLISHFNEDENSGIAVCTANRWPAGELPWVAVDSGDRVVARGRVVVAQIGNVIQSPQIVQDEPPR